MRQRAVHCAAIPRSAIAHRRSRRLLGAGARPSSAQQSTGRAAAACRGGGARAGRRTLRRRGDRRTKTLRRLSPGTAEVHARLGLIYFQEGKFDAAVPHSARGDPAETGIAEGRCAAGHVALGDRPLRRGAAGRHEGLLSVRRSGPATDGWTPPPADLHGTRTRSGRRRRRAEDCRDSTRTIPRCCTTRAGCSRTSPTCRRCGSRPSRPSPCGCTRRRGKRTRARVSTTPRSASTGRY